jgi:effector-binding domain-containing protein
MASSSYSVTVRRVGAQPVLCMRGTTTVAGIPQILHRFLPQVWRHAASKGLEPAGPPYTRYWKIEGAEVEIEAGLPVTQAVEGEGEVLAYALPAGEVAATDHYGAYEGLPQAGAALERWAAENGREAAGPRWEIYWTDPTTAPQEEWRTEVVMPLK